MIEASPYSPYEKDTVWIVTSRSTAASSWTRVTVREKSPLAATE